MGAQDFYLRKEVISLKLEPPLGMISESPWGHQIKHDSIRVVFLV